MTTLSFDNYLTKVFAMNGIGTQTIETERLILRKMELGDAEFIFTNWTSDPLVSRFVSWR